MKSPATGKGHWHFRCPDVTGVGLLNTNLAVALHSSPQSCNSMLLFVLTPWYQSCGVFGPLKDTGLLNFVTGIGLKTVICWRGVYKGGTGVHVVLLPLRKFKQGT